MSNKEIIYWKMRNGKSISVDDMDLNHLRNVLKMIIRNNQKVQTTCPHNATQALDMEDIESPLEIGMTDIEKRALRQTTVIRM